MFYQPDDTHIVAGMSDGTLSVRRRQPKASEASAAGESAGIPSLTSQSQRKISRDPAEIRIDKVSSKRLKEHDKLLKSFRYSAALDSVLKKVRTSLFNFYPNINFHGQNTPPVTTFSLIRELVHRDGLRTALGGRDDVMLEPILRFLMKYVTDPRFGQLVVDTTSALMGMHLNHILVTTLIYCRHLPPGHWPKSSDRRPVP